ncbi:hypothetical protein [Halorarum salinum]|uniref:Uncharacterized protein n=1 Tax=Halorarum salinum TaxID=2743089 RepID=A0A7D5L8W2_9EURY|nr:hypothetical protein [Halobaculum salinum]QLG60792.1 hypothetical protein HUG12_03135 [Halobaculum salinum]
MNASNGSRGADRPRTVEWSADGAARARAAVRHLVAGVLLGTALLCLLLLAALAVGTAAAGDAGLLALVVVIALVGGPASLVYVAVAADRGGLSGLADRVPGLGSLRPRWLAATTPLGVALLLAGLAYPPLLAGYLVGFPLLAFGGSVLFPAGRLDPGTATLTAATDGRERTHDLSGLDSFSCRRVGPVALCRLRFVGTRGLNAPFLFAVPADRVGEVRPALAAIRERTDAAGAGRPRAVVATLFAFGGVFLLAALGLVVVSLRRGEGAVAAYGGTLVGGPGLFLCWLGLASRG